MVNYLLYLVMLFSTLFTIPVTRYVSDTGSGSVCSLSSPCSFTTAQSVSKPGDTIHILGTWTRAISITVNGIAGSPVIIEGDAIQAPTTASTAVLVNGSNLELRNLDISGGWEFGVRVKGSNVKLSGLKVHDSVWENRSGASCIGGSGGWGRGVTFAPTAHNIEVIGGKIYNNCGEGLTVTQNSNSYLHDLEVYNNFSRNVYIGNAAYVTVENIISYYSDPNFYRNGAPGRCIGLAIESTNYSTYGNIMHDTIIRGNNLHDCLGINFYAEIANQYPSNVLVEYNIFHNVPSPQIQIPGTNIVIRNNTIYPIGTSTAPTEISTPTFTETPTPTFTETSTEIPIPTSTETPTPVPTATFTPTLDVCSGGLRIFEDLEYVICAFPK